MSSIPSRSAKRTLKLPQFTSSKCTLNRYPTSLTIHHGVFIPKIGGRRPSHPLSHLTHLGSLFDRSWYAGESSCSSIPLAPMANELSFEGRPFHSGLSRVISSHWKAFAMLWRRGGFFGAFPLGCTDTRKNDVSSSISSLFLWNPSSEIVSPFRIPCTNITLFCIHSCEDRTFSKTRSPPFQSISSPDGEMAL